MNHMFQIRVGEIMADENPLKPCRSDGFQHTLDICYDTLTFETAPTRTEAKAV